MASKLLLMKTEKISNGYKSYATNKTYTCGNCKEKFTRCCDEVDYKINSNEEVLHFCSWDCKMKYNKKENERKRKELYENFKTKEY